MAFVAFDLCASAQYLFNDLLDLPADRHDPLKKSRMIASGRLDLKQVLILMAALLAGGLIVAAQVSIPFVAVTALYVLLMVTYSLRLKHIPIIDVLVLAIGYTLRVGAGAVAIHAAPSPWLLTLSVFLFLSLAMIKRYSALATARPGALPSSSRYGSQDQPLLLAEGIASGYVAVAVSALFVNTDICRQLYTRPEFLWPCCVVLLYWVSYLWFMASRGRIVGDPVLFAVSNPSSRWSLCLLLALAALAL